MHSKIEKIQVASGMLLLAFSKASPIDSRDKLPPHTSSPLHSIDKLSYVSLFKAATSTNSFKSKKLLVWAIGLSEALVIFES